MRKNVIGGLVFLIGALIGTTSISNARIENNIYKNHVSSNILSEYDVNDNLTEKISKYLISNPEFRDGDMMVYSERDRQIKLGKNFIIYQNQNASSIIPCVTIYDLKKDDNSEVIVWSDYKIDDIEERQLREHYFRKDYFEHLTSQIEKGELVNSELKGKIIGLNLGDEQLYFDFINFVFFYTTNQLKEFNNLQKIEARYYSEKFNLK